ncbi:Crp/Fnr family transcriptional regulator [Aquimarina sp. 2201CG1-2-11]|uniref:Crp/Fnr family transcriptional regulator n=1 Tax=Aquimarina discodermiae TaxID=3231043 RepID=UPI0034628AC2
MDSLFPNLKLLAHMKDLGLYTKHQFLQNKNLYDSTYTTNKIIYVADGTLKAYSIDEDGGYTILFLLSKGQTFIEDETSIKAFYNYNLESIPLETTVYIFDLKDIYKILNKRPDFHQDFYRLWIEKYNLLDKRIRIIHQKSIQTRLIQVLLEFQENYGYTCPETEDIIINSPLNQEELAGYLRSSRVSVNNIIQTLKYKLLLDYDKKRIVLKKNSFSNYICHNYSICS